MALAVLAVMRAKLTHKPRPTLADALERPANLLTPVRLLLALGVVLGHSFVNILGDSAPEPLILFNITISYAAVNGFFILSGLLISRSFDRNPDLIRFVVSRVLRLMPALIVLSLMAVFVFGPVFTSLSPWAYFTDMQTWRYLCDVLSFGNTSGGPPQIYANNPWAGEFSASLWTLRYEAMAYAGTVLIGLTGLARTRTRVLALFAGSIMAFMLVRALPDFLPNAFIHLSRFAMAYLLGALLYAWRDTVRIDGRWALAAVAVALLFGSTASYEIALNFALAAGVLMIGFGLPAAFAPLARIPDLSYGIYIWQWAVMQSLYHWGIARDPYTMMALAIPLSAVIAALSWYAIEKPALAHKAPLTAWLHGRLRRVPGPA